MSRRHILAAALSVVACSRPAGLELTAIEPDVVSSQRATPAVLSGTGLLGTVTVDLDDDSEPAVDQGWQVSIAGTTAEVSTPDGGTSLAITIPAGLPLGTHDVVVTAPGGATDTLPGALTVIEGDPGGCVVCDGGSCAGGCTITCGAGDCPDPVVCPTGIDCVINCGGGSSCAAGVDCSGAASCTIDCSGNSSCQGSIVCGPGPCEVQCSGNDSCPQLDCASACACDITCSGSSTCQPPATCPDGCEQGRGCSSAGVGCDTCS